MEIRKFSKLAKLAGVLQGDLLTSYIFILVVDYNHDYVMRTALIGREYKLGFQLLKKIKQKSTTYQCYRYGLLR